MQQFLAYGIVGLSTAAIYAIIGSGLVLTYTTTGVFNFAQGAVGMLAAFTYWQLTIGWGWPVLVALAVVLLVLAPAFGLLVERVLMRPVQGLGEAQRLVVTVALLSGLIAAARWIWNPNLVRALPPFFPSAASLRLGPATITWHQAITMIVAVLVAAGLWAVLHRTRTGAEMRAVVDDRALAGLMGADPVRANRVAWILGTQMAAVGGILIAPELTLDATQLSLLIVSAYTAAVFGRLRSLPLTFAGAVVVGALIAVPALRLSGIYLALGTAAFAVVCDQWIFNLPSFQVFGNRIALFNQGSVSAVGPRLFGLTLGSEPDLMVLAAVCLGLLSLGVAALRRGRFGRRLIALHDSEAAYATLGGSLLAARVAVFALAAGMAGLGGALYTMQQQSVTAGQFSLVAGLPIFLIAVVGGLASVGDGLFTGITVGGSFAALVEVVPWAGNLAAILPALAGIGLGSNPDGVVPRLRRDGEPVGRNRIVAAAVVGGLTLAWALRLAHVINGWVFFGAALLVVLAARGYATARQPAGQGGRQPEIPVEWWGVRRDWRPEDEEVLARGIAGG